MRQVVFMTKTDGWGGTEKHLLEVIRRISRNSCKCIIAEEYSDKYTSVYTDAVAQAGLTDVTVLVEPVNVSPSRCYRFFRRVGGDTVVFIYGGYGVFPWYSPLMARLAGITRCFKIHHLIAPALPQWPGESRWQRLKRLLFRGWRRRLIAAGGSRYICRKTICVSNAVRQRLIDSYHYSPEATLTIHNGTSISHSAEYADTRAEVRAEFSLTDADTLIICVARLAPVKGVDILLRSISTLNRRGEQCHCLLLGDGPLADELKSVAVSLGVADRVHFVGFKRDVARYLQGSDIFALPSHSEGLPYSVLEAMACGLPCVVTDVGGNREAIEHMVHGMVVPPGSEPALTSALSTLTKDRATRKKMAHAARIRVEEQFDVDIKMAEVLRTLQVPA